MYDFCVMNARLYVTTYMTTCMKLYPNMPSFVAKWFKKHKNSKILEGFCPKIYKSPVLNFLQEQIVFTFFIKCLILDEQMVLYRHDKWTKMNYICTGISKNIYF